MAKIVSKPSTKKLKNRAFDFASGFGGAGLYQLLTTWFGSSFWASAGSAVVVGSVLPEERGAILTTMLGFQAGLEAFGGGGSGGDSLDSGVM